MDIAKHLTDTSLEIVENIVALFIDDDADEDTWLLKNPYTEKHMRFAVTKFLDQEKSNGKIDSYEIISVLSNPTDLDIRLIIGFKNIQAQFGVKENFYAD